MEASLTQQLKAAREARGLTLADVAHETRIPIPRLRQIEEGNLAAFGNMAYARSFLRLYGAFVNVDVDALLIQLPQPVLGGRQDYRHLTESYGPWIDQYPGRVRRPQRASAEPVSFAARGVYAVVLMLVLGVCSVVLFQNFLLPKSVRKVAAQEAHAATAKVVPVQIKPATGSKASWTGEADKAEATEFAAKVEEQPARP